jgi:hypothetical protein
MASTDALIAPIKNTAFRMPVGPFFKTDGTLITNWTSADSEISEDGANFADCTNEATEIQTSGVGFLDLTSGETDCDSFWIKTTISNTDAVPFVAYFATQRAGAYLRSDVRENAGTAITSAAGVQEVKVASIAADAVNAAAIANGAIDAATFAADVDAEILSYIVDDATRIDASALNAAAVTSVPAILGDTNELQTDWVNGGRLDLLIDAIKAVTDAQGGANAVETGVSLLGSQRAILAALAGVATGGSSTSIVLKNPAGDTTRVTLTVDADGNRSASTLNV